MLGLCRLAPWLVVLLGTLPLPASGSGGAHTKFMQLAQTAVTLDLSGHIGGRADILMKTVRRFDLRHSVKKVAVCNGANSGQVVSVEPHTGNLEKHFVISLSVPGAKLPDLVGDDAKLAGEALLDLGFSNVTAIGDGHRVTAVEPDRKGECIALNQALTLDKSIQRRGRDAVMACAPPENARLYSRGRANTIQTYVIRIGSRKRHELSILRLAVPTGFILSRVVMLDGTSPYFYGLFTMADQSPRTIIRAFCRSDGRLISQYEADQGNFSLGMKEIAQVFGIQTGQTAIVIWHQATDQWFNVYTEREIHDFTIIERAGRLVVVYMSMDGRLFHQELENAAAPKLVWRLRRASDVRDRLLNFGQDVLLVSRNGWRRFALDKNAIVDSYSVNYGFLQSVDVFFTPDGLSQGYLVIYGHRSKDSGSFAQVVWRGASGKIHKLNDIAIPGLGSREVVGFAMPVSSDFQRIRLATVYNDGPQSGLRCYVISKPLRAQRWVAELDGEEIQFDSHIDFRRLHRVRVSGREAIVYASGPLQFGVGFEPDVSEFCWAAE